jgi:hypothetical protein
MMPGSKRIEPKVFKNSILRELGDEQRELSDERRELNESSVTSSESSARAQQ